MLIANRNLRITNKNLALTTLSNDVRLNLSKDIRQTCVRRKIREAATEE